MRWISGLRRPGAAGLLGVLLAAMAITALVATGAALVRLETTQRSLGTQENESLIWTFLQMEREVDRVSRGLARLSDPADTAARAELVQSLDIALSRIEMLEISPLLDLGADGARMRALLNKAVEALLVAAPWFEALPASVPTTEDLRVHRALIDGAAAALRQLTNTANETNARLRKQLQDANSNTFWSLVAAVGALLGTLAAASVLLARQYRGLNAARQAAERMGGELRATAEAAQAATIAKTAFLATMSHEIRTPMNGVIGSVSLLTQTALSDRQLRLVETISACGTALLALIDDVLDISRLESGRMELEEQPFDPRALVESATDMLAARVAEHGIELVAAVGPEVPALLLGDGARLRQVVVNLLSNAVKFTERGGVALRMEVDGEGRLRIAVRDSGIGIPPAAQVALFDDFTQADPTISRRFGGTGLGLAICRRLVTAMGGRIGVESVPGEGSSFHVTLALHAAAPPPEPPPSETAQVRLRTVGAPGPVAEGMALLARALGWASDDAEAATVETVLVPVTGPATAAPRVVRYGPGGMLVPPYTAMRMTRALARERRPDTAAPSVAAPSARRLRVLVAEDTRVNQEVIRGLLDHLGHDVTVVANGEEAVVAARSGAYDLVLMDMQMPCMDGLAATRAIRALAPDPAAEVAIVALTANSFAHDREACLAAGMDGFVAKPITLERLQAAVAIPRHAPAA
jgi:signal transduction histidine kinase/ActR/RegA family two-component response regulator